VGNATKFGTFYFGRWYREYSQKKEADEARARGDVDYFKTKTRIEKVSFLSAVYIFMLCHC
jgi:hypothetical protein